MALLTVQSITRAGVLPTYAAAAGGGDTFLPSTDTFLHVKNGSGGALTVTAATPGSVAGLAIADAAVSVPATSERMIGPFPAEYFADPTTGLCNVTYSGVTSLTVAAVQVVKP